MRIEATCLGVVDRKIYTGAEGLLVAAHGDTEGTLALRSAALFITVPVEHFTAFGRADLVESSLNRTSESRHVEVNP